MESHLSRILIVIYSRTLHPSTKFPLKLTLDQPFSREDTATSNSRLLKLPTSMIQQLIKKQAMVDILWVSSVEATSMHCATASLQVFRRMLAMFMARASFISSAAPASWRAFGSCAALVPMSKLLTVVGAHHYTRHAGQRHHVLTLLNQF